jgi:ATP-dependent protease HslVU (ClpYQ) ATPase subunit
MHFVLGLLLALFVTVNSQPSDNMVLFIEGFAAGLEVEIGNPAVCAKDLNITEEDLIKGFAKIKQGIADVSISDIEEGLQDWSAALLEVNQALSDCGAGNLTADVEAILQEINSGVEGVIEFIAKEILAIIENNVQTLFNSAISAMDAGNFYSAGEFSGEIVGILLEQFTPRIQ